MPSRRDQQAAPPPIDREITIAEGITVKELSEKLGVKANLVIKKLVEKKIFATINQTLDTKMAEASGARVRRFHQQGQLRRRSHAGNRTRPKMTRDLVKRAPVVTIMGHVDHGKTSLLDAIRLTNVADKEAGGITQHIGAYYIEKNGRKIVFIDTPGHEAFTRMRARGAKVTDIVVLVVAADDGVMPQTLEAIDHARAAGVPIIVAINKIDKPDAQPDRIKQQLSDRGLVPEEWGGDTVMVPVSARAKTNLDLLLEMILLVADLQDLQGQSGPSGGRQRARSAIGSRPRSGGDRSGSQRHAARRRLLHLRRGVRQSPRHVRRSRPADPRSRAVHAGRGARSGFAARSGRHVPGGHRYRQGQADRHVPRIEGARRRHGEERPHHAREAATRWLREGEVKELNIILKTDVGGTAEVLSDMMQKLSNDKVRIRVIRAGVGAINESDVLLASASNAIIIGFNVRPERNADRTRRAGEGRHPPPHHHLRTHRRDEASHDRHAGAGVQRSLPGPCRSPRSVPHHQGRQRGRLLCAGRLPQARAARCACCATTSWSTPARSIR